MTVQLLIILIFVSTRYATAFFNRLKLHDLPLAAGTLCQICQKFKFKSKVWATNGEQCLAHLPECPALDFLLQPQSKAAALRIVSKNNIQQLALRHAMQATTHKVISSVKRESGQVLQRVRPAPCPSLLAPAFGFITYFLHNWCYYHGC